jgi:hypothetical protein
MGGPPMSSVWRAVYEKDTAGRQRYRISAAMI